MHFICTQKTLTAEDFKAKETQSHKASGHSYLKSFSFMFETALTQLS